jgi:hypothetical protein
MACYGDNFTLLYVDVFVPHKKQTYRPPRSVTGTALLFYLLLLLLLNTLLVTMAYLKPIMSHVISYV